MILRKEHHYYDEYSAFCISLSLSKVENFHVDTCYYIILGQYHYSYCFMEAQSHFSA
jgi:hypothetical protein